MSLLTFYYGFPSAIGDQSLDKLEIQRAIWLRCMHIDSYILPQKCILSPAL